MTAAISRRPCPTPTTIAPPAASRYSRPSASTIVEPCPSTATGGLADAARRNTRPLTGERAGTGDGGLSGGSRADCRFGGVVARPVRPGRRSRLPRVHDDDRLARRPAGFDRHLLAQEAHEPRR